MMQSQCIALVAAFNRAGQVLLLKRDEKQLCAGMWSFPGGKVEQGELAKAAAIRELKEETGLTGSDWQHLGAHCFTYPDRLLHFQLFSCVCDPLQNLSYESEHAWIGMDALEHYPMPAANSTLLPMLNGRAQPDAGAR